MEFQHGLLVVQESITLISVLLNHTRLSSSQHQLPQRFSADLEQLQRGTPRLVLAAGRTQHLRVESVGVRRVQAEETLIEAGPAHGVMLGIISRGDTSVTDPVGFSTNCSFSTNCY